MLNIGIGLTSMCNCNCSHCYSRIYGNQTFLDTNRLFKFVNRHDINSVNFGTGESFFHPDFREILSVLVEKGIKVSLTTNGYTITKMEDLDVRKLHDVDFSLDYPSAELHNMNRQTGCFEMVIDGIRRCKALGVTASIAWCLTPQNSIYIPEMVSLCKKENVFLRVNIYKPVPGSHGFSYKQFWESINNLFKYGNIISCSEGIVNAAINNKSECHGCNSRNIRIFPDGTVSSCVYIQNKGITIEDVCEMTEDELATCFSLQYELPKSSACRECKYHTLCYGGCLARRVIAGSSIDEFCFIDNYQPTFERIVFSEKQADYFVHSNYICTIIMEAAAGNDASTK